VFGESEVSVPWMWLDAVLLQTMLYCLQFYTVGDPY